MRLLKVRTLDKLKLTQEVHRSSGLLVTIHLENWKATPAKLRWKDRDQEGCLASLAIIHKWIACSQVKEMSDGAIVCSK